MGGLETTVEVDLRPLLKYPFDPRAGEYRSFDNGVGNV